MVPPGPSTRKRSASPAAGAKPTQPPDPADSADAPDPADPTDPTDPTDPPDLADPADPPDPPDRPDPVTRVSNRDPSMSLGRTPAGSPTAATSGTPTAAVSMIGNGNATRPVSASTSAIVTSGRPEPPTSVGASRPCTPRAANSSHNPRRGAPLPAAHASCSAGREHCLSSRAATVSRPAICSASKPKCNSPYFRGRPSNRSAAMLRWISLVPA